MNEHEQDPENHSAALEKFYKAVAIVNNGGSAEAVPNLESLQEWVRANSIISSNETLDDMATFNIPWLSLNHYLAKALTQLPVINREKMRDRLVNLQRACDFWLTFFETMENMELLSDQEQCEYHTLVEVSDSWNEENQKIFSTNRDTKIARYNARKQVEQEMEKLRALRDRRKRLGLGSEEMDGYDQESLNRSLALKSLDLAKQDAIEEWSSAVQGKSET